MSFLNGYKTYIVAGATVLYAAVEAWTGAITSQAAIAMILAALGGASMRHGISTGGKR